MQIEGSAESISRLLAEHENLRRRILELEAAQRSWQAERTSCQGEKTLRESNQVLTVILENTHMRVAYLDAGVNFIWVNRAFADAGGHEPAFFHGKNYFELYPDTEKQAVFQTVVATGKSYMAAATPFVPPSQARSGLTYWDVGLIPIQDRAGRTTSLVFTLVEATERVKAAESLRDSEARFRTAFENAAVGMALIDLDGRAIGANTALAQMLGYQKRELIGKTVREVMHPDDYGDHLRLFRDLLEARTQYGDSERRLRCKDGAIIHTQVWSTIHRDETGAPLQLVSIVRDVTEQIRTQKEKARLESQLRQAQKMEAIGTLAGGIAHDFNNILSIIIGNAELLESETALRGSAGDELNQIRIAAQRAKHLVRQILAFSRQEGQRKESLNLKPVLKETIDFLRASLPATIQLECNIGQNVGFIMGDPTQVQQVLMNLCTNASHAMEKDGGRLSLDVEQVVIEGDHVSHDQSLTPGEYVRLTIADTGHGMEPWILPRIFDPYFTTKGPDKGTGLGLSVVHGIVKSHGGTISVRSRPGQGTTFAVFLPSTEGVEEKDEEGFTSLPNGDESLLLVDDEKSIVDMYCRRLGGLGYAVTPCTCPVEAFELFQKDQNRFDLVVTDLTMPRISGINLARQLLALRPGIPVILCTGFSEQLDDDGRSIGIRAFLHKPLLLKDLAHTIRQVLDEKNGSPSRVVG